MKMLLCENSSLESSIDDVQAEYYSWIVELLLFITRYIVLCVGGGSIMEKGKETDSKLVAQSSEVVAENHIDQASKAPLNERKRHRDGQSSRSHHGKKLKEPMNCSSKDEVSLSTRSRLDVRVRSSMRTPAASDSRVGGPRICKTYVEKVIPSFIYLPFLLSFFHDLC